MWNMYFRDMAAVYILASRKYGTLYIGVTADLVQRVGQHRAGEIPGFTAKYDVKRLVWFERHDGIVTAIQREKSLKRYLRQWKINLIEQDNPNWDDLYAALQSVPPLPAFAAASSACLAPARIAGRA